MDDNEVSKLLKSYLDKTSLDDPTDELNELRPAIGKLTAAFSASKLAHERQKLVVAAISVLANHLRVNSVQADVLIECQKQLANLNDQRPSELFTPSRKASRQHANGVRGFVLLRPPSDHGLRGADPSPRRCWLHGLYRQPAASCLLP